MIRSKKGIEVSVNFLIILVMAIVVFGMGIIIIFQMMGAGDQLVTNVTDDLRKDVQQLLSSLEGAVAIPYQTIEVDRGDAASIVVGVQNVLEGEQEFVVELSLGAGLPNTGGDGYIRPGGAEVNACSGSNRCVKFGTPDPTVNRVSNPTRIPEQGYEVFLFPVSTKSANPGAYIFTVTVKCTGNGVASCINTDYDAPQKVLVVVK